MFSKLDKEDKEIVINAMEERSFDQGATVIKQEDSGDVLFVIESG